jgi:hypothetical protein
MFFTQSDRVLIRYAAGVALPLEWVAFGVFMRFPFDESLYPVNHSLIERYAGFVALTVHFPGVMVFGFAQSMLFLTGYVTFLILLLVIITLRRRIRNLRPCNGFERQQMAALSNNLATPRADPPIPPPRKIQ